MTIINRAFCFVDRMWWRVYAWWLSCQSGVVMGTITIVGMPLIQVCKGGRLVMENKVRLWSRNADYHVNLFAPVKLLVSRPGAVIKIGQNTRVYGSSINAFERVEIGSNCLIAANCQIMDANGHALSFENLENRPFTKDKGRAVVIEDNVWLGTGVIILPGVRIGKGSIVGAGSVVSHDVPPMCLVAGNPARVIREYSANSDAHGREGIPA
jgi:acetyltransferase-like isoleucine patch superfamily enzyme